MSDVSRVKIDLGVDTLAVLIRLTAAIEALAAGQAAAPDPSEYADPERVRVWASQHAIAISANISFDDIARVNTKRLEYGRPPFVLRTTP